MDDCGFCKGTFGKADIRRNSKRWRRWGEARACRARGASAFGKVPPGGGEWSWHQVAPSGTLWHLTPTNFPKSKRRNDPYGATKILMLGATSWHLGGTFWHHVAPCQTQAQRQRARPVPVSPRRRTHREPRTLRLPPRSSSSSTKACLKRGGLTRSAEIILPKQTAEHVLRGRGVGVRLHGPVGPPLAQAADLFGVVKRPGQGD
jgi:hypothetical protein